MNTAPVPKPIGMPYVIEVPREKVFDVFASTDVNMPVSEAFQEFIDRRGLKRWEHFTYGVNFQTISSFVRFVSEQDAIEFKLELL